MPHTSVASGADSRTDATRQQRRRERDRARSVVWDITTLSAVEGCGRRVRDAAGVTLRVSECGGQRVAGYGGLATCGSVWACPVCASKVAAVRAGELQEAITAWHALGGRVVHATFTMRHRRGQQLTTLWDAVQGAWHHMTSGRAWKADQAVYGAEWVRAVKSDGKRHRRGDLVTEQRIMTVRAVEVTHGDSGWHVHIHAALLIAGEVHPGTTLARPVTDVDVQLLRSSMLNRWSGWLKARGFGSVNRRAANRVRLVDVDEGFGAYLAPVQYRRDPVRGAALEITHGVSKQAADGHRAPFQVLEDIVSTGDMDDVDLWHEWETGSRGRRQLTWSPGLRDRLLAGEPELTDEEIAAQDDAGEIVLLLEHDTWREVYRRSARLELLEAAEGPPGTLGRLLRRLGITGLASGPPTRTAA